ncbi:hypothetical protein [Carnimonas nigrificans]|uniref:hypothetical protein n=1 Tax=Carnimonas nigrificans TaxID=64323 RepID=UPI000472C0AF|nr:hypothetical protein [Carnimonas nigrificans]
MRYRKAPLVSDIHYLLGSTLRDAENDRIGRVIGLNQYHARPILEVLWEESGSIERVDISVEQLDSLMEMARARSQAGSSSSDNSTADTEVEQDDGKLLRRA